MTVVTISIGESMASLRLHDRLGADADEVEALCLPAASHNFLLLPLRLWRLDFRLMTASLSSMNPSESFDASMGDEMSPSVDATSSSFAAVKRGMRNEHLRSHRPRRPCKTIIVRRSPNVSLETIPEYYPSRLRVFHVMIFTILGFATVALRNQKDWMKPSLTGNMHRQLVELRPEHLEQYPFNSFLDTSDPTPEFQKHVTGFFWHVPRAGGERNPVVALLPVSFCFFKLKFIHFIS